VEGFVMPASKNLHNKRHCHNPRLPSDLLFVFHLNHEIAKCRIAYVRNFMPWYRGAQGRGVGDSFNLSRTACIQSLYLSTA